MYFILEDGDLEIDNNATERYLAYLFDKMTGIDDFSKFNFEALMPWEDEILECIKKKKN